MQNTDYKIVIPARYASSRLPGKPLRLIAGKTMIQHTYERAIQSHADEVLIATDDQRIADAVSQFTDNIIMTSTEHTSGTERLAEVLVLKAWHEETIIVNVQGDEPLVSPAHIDLVARSLINNTRAGMATLASTIDSVEQIYDTNIVKLVMDYQGYALYFSRAMIPWSRDSFSLKTIEQQAIKTLTTDAQWYRHIGMYAYRGTALKQYMTLPACALEQIESLEQLRMLYNGIAIHVSVIDNDPGVGVDVEADLEKVELLLAQQPAGV